MVRYGGVPPVQYSALTLLLLGTTTFDGDIPLDAFIDPLILVPLFPEHTIACI